MTQNPVPDWHELEIMDLDSGKKLAVELTRSSSPTAWLKDGFFYATMFRKTKRT